MNETRRSARPSVYQSRGFYILIACCTVAVLVGEPAFAQTMSPPSAVPAPPAAAPEAAPAPVAPVEVATPAGPTIEQRLDELDQRIRISERKAELAQEALAAERKAATVSTVDEKGLNVKSADGNFRVGVHALIQVDGRRLFDAPVILETKDTFLIRRLRPTIDASWLGIADARLTTDFGNGSVSLVDAYIDIGPRPWLRLRTGKFKPPVGLERLQSDPDLVFNERALTANLAAQRDVGVELRGDIIGGVVRYSIGVFNGAANNASPDVDIDHAKTFAGRLFLQPFAVPSLKPFGKLGVGFGFTTGEERGSPALTSGAASSTWLGAFRTTDQNNFFQYLSSTTDTSATVFAYDRHTRLNPQLFYYFGPVGLLADYVHEYQQVAKGGTVYSLKNAAAHGTLSYVYGGDETFEGVTPKHPVDMAAGHIGAIEVGVRYEWLKVDNAAFPTLADPTKSAREAQSLSGALNWYLSRNLRTNVNYAQTWFKGGAAMDGNRQTEKAVIARLQANF
jgi:phosphate-selective porin OprO/OprP